MKTITKIKRTLVSIVLAATIGFTACGPDVDYSTPLQSYQYETPTQVSPNYFVEAGEIESVLATGSSTGEAMASADFDCNGLEDIVYIRPNAGDVHLYLNIGDGNYEYAGIIMQLPIFSSSIGASLAAFDYNNDGLPDLAYKFGNQEKIIIYENQGVGDFCQE